jgi:hypothetical protein
VAAKFCKVREKREIPHYADSVRNDEWLYSGILKEEKKRSQFGVGRGVGIATRILSRSGLHEFNAAPVGIKNIELPFAIAADFGFVVGEFGIGRETVFVELLEGFLHVGDAETEVILHAEFLMIGVGRDVQHKFDPVVAVGHLDFEPVDVGVFFGSAGRKILKAAFPVEAEAELVHIKVAHGREILDDETGVEDAKAHLSRRGGRRVGCFFDLDEDDVVSLGILRFDDSAAVRGGLDIGHGDALGFQVIAHSGDIVSAEGNFIEPGTWGAGVRVGQLDVLVAVHDETGILNAGAAVAAGGEAEDFGVGFGGLLEIARFDADIGDAVDFWTLRRLGTEECGEEKERTK